MTDVAPAPAPDAMPGIEVAPEVAAPEKPKCETLYIQNLNEKIKLDGTGVHTFLKIIKADIHSNEVIVEGSLQALRRRRCCGPQELADARPGICVIRIDRAGRKGDE